MTWEWSHTQEAYVNARRNLAELPKQELSIIYAEWRASEPRSTVDADDLDAPNEDDLDETGFDEQTYQVALSEAYDLTLDDLETFVWARTEDMARCDNGGWSAHVCPYGCHVVSFDRDEGEDDEG